MGFDCLKYVFVERTSLEGGCEVQGQTPLVPTYLLRAGDARQLKECLEYVYLRHQSKLFTVSIKMQDEGFLDGSWIEKLYWLLISNSYLKYDGQLLIFWIDESNRHSFAREQLKKKLSELHLQSVVYQVTDDENRPECLRFMSIYRCCGGAKLEKWVYAKMEAATLLPSIYMGANGDSDLKESVEELGDLLQTFSVQHQTKFHALMNLRKLHDEYEAIVEDLGYEKTLRMDQEQYSKLSGMRTSMENGKQGRMNEIARLKHFYYQEYEILPSWYKKLGHIIKVIMGKRSFRSLFNDNVKKYKD